MIKDSEIKPIDFGKILQGNISGWEKEVHQEGKKQSKESGIHARGNFVVPFGFLNERQYATRDLTVGTDSQGGYTVATDLRAGSFIELLRNATRVAGMGATVLSNLRGDVAIPKQATGATAAWEGENDAGSEQSQTFGQAAMSPNRVGCYTEVSKQLSVQSSLSINQLILSDLAAAIGQAIDYAALHGSGSGNEPTGIANTSGIGSVAGGTNGLAPTWAHIVELETAVAELNGNLNTSTMGYLTNSKVRGKLKQIFKNSTYGEIPLWQSKTDGGLNGYRAEVSNQVSSTLTKGSSSGICSAIFFGDWSQVVIGLWGGLDMVVDPYSLATTNMTRITCNTYADMCLRNSESFSCMLDCLT